MTAIIDTVWRSRLKGAWGVRPRYLEIDTTVGVVDDRDCALRRRPGNMTKWQPKGVYHVCMNTPQMATERAVFNQEGRLQNGYLLDLAAHTNIQGEPQVQYADKTYSLHDTEGAFVSFINLATVDALSAFMGVTIDPRRFRMNGWIRGLDAFEELTWVDADPGTRIIEVGELRLRVDHECKRCRAPEANPETGQHDLEIEAALTAMMGQRGYKSPRGEVYVMGILAAPLQCGILRKGDQIKLV